MATSKRKHAPKSTRGTRKASRPGAPAPPSPGAIEVLQPGRPRATKSTFEAQQFDARFEAVDDILRGELYLAGGFATARAFIADRLPGMTEETVRDYAKVARHSTAAIRLEPIVRDPVESGPLSELWRIDPWKRIGAAYWFSGCGCSSQSR